MKYQPTFAPTAITRSLRKRIHELKRNLSIGTIVPQITKGNELLFLKCQFWELFVPLTKTKLEQGVLILATNEPFVPTYYSGRVRPL